MIVWLSGWMADRLTGRWQSKRLTDWLTDWSVGWQMDTVTRLLPDYWLTDKLSSEVVDRWAEWRTTGLIEGLVDWWIISWLTVCLRMTGLLASPPTHCLPYHFSFSSFPVELQYQTLPQLKPSSAYVWEPVLQRLASINL